MAQTQTSPTFSQAEKDFLHGRLELYKQPADRSTEYRISGFPDYHSEGFGRAYIHRQVDSLELSMAILSPKALRANASFGFAVDLRDSTALVGAPGGGTIHKGEAYLFERSVETWRTRQVLNAPDGNSRDDFGYSVALTENYVIVGAPSANSKYLETGAVYAFKTGKEEKCQFQQKIQPRRDRDVLHFGKYIQVRDELLLIGAESFKFEMEIAFVYEFRESSWKQVDLLDSEEELQAFFNQHPKEERSGIRSLESSEIVVGTRPTDWSQQ